MFHVEINIRIPSNPVCRRYVLVIAMEPFLNESAIARSEKTIPEYLSVRCVDNLHVLIEVDEPKWFINYRGLLA